MITVQDFKYKYLGEIGTEVRDRYEQELKVELLAEQIKQIRKERNLTQEQLVHWLASKELKFQKWRTIRGT
jgi:DNA-binding transcriptional regulator YiaG